MHLFIHIVRNNMCMKITCLYTAKILYLCAKCSSNVIEDELHFLFECSKYDEDRESMLFEITTVCSNFRNLNSQNKLIWLFNSENIELLKTLCKFILRHLP